MDTKLPKRALPKRAVRAGVVVAGTALMLLMASPAFASAPVPGNHGKGLSIIQTLGLFVATPLALFGIIAGLVIVTDKSRKQQRS